MIRRAFLTTGAAAATLLALPIHAAPLDYTPGLVKDRLAAGETVFLDFKASWCATCKAQEQVMDRLKAENPEYEANITFIAVDWDTYARSQFTQRLRVPRRSTLVVLKGDGEVGRLIADTREVKIRELMDAALAASSV
ncbi:thioredoxin family protein [Pseudooceanicola aestuarii]|uniref:thioredoxin family protein n=1 Tax=Pseudooceanicola aestuarii TaxID=2697319 RepID=UPI0013D0A4D6|nr:thioredoxin family protein [Pseudooceanicola aestuarii]